MRTMHEIKTMPASVTDLTDEPWYSARCIFRFLRSAEGATQSVYEERIVLLKAKDFREAVRRATDDAKRYAADASAEFTEFVDVYHLFDGELADGVEAFSLLRTSNLNPQEYVKRHFDTGAEFRDER